MRGTPHVHSLIWIANDGITEETVNSEDGHEQQKVKNSVKKTVSAILEGGREEGNEWERIRERERQLGRTRDRQTGRGVESTFRVGQFLFQPCKEFALSSTVSQVTRKHAPQLRLFWWEREGEGKGEDEGDWEKGWGDDDEGEDGCEKGWVHGWESGWVRWVREW